MITGSNVISDWSKEKQLMTNQMSVFVQLLSCYHFCPTVGYELENNLLGSENTGSS